MTILLLSACSTNVPKEISQPLTGNPGLNQVQHNPDSWRTKKVRWGGIITSTDNKENASELTIVAMPLMKDGEPEDSDQSQGRFIAIIDHFVEPKVYSPDRKITLTGYILRTEKRTVGEYPYEYPVVQVESYYLWPADPEPAYIDYPPYPWYDPYYPWHYPYYRYPYW